MWIVVFIADSDLLWNMLLGSVIPIVDRVWFLLGVLVVVGARNFAVPVDLVQMEELGICPGLLSHARVMAIYGILGRMAISMACHCRCKAA